MAMTSDRARSVADIMSRPVVMATPSETVADAATRMREQKVGSVVVCEGDHPVGILTERDLVRAAAAGASSSSDLVADWMTPDPDSVAPELEVADAFANLSE